MLLAAGNLFSQKYQLEGGDFIHLRGSYEDDSTLDGNYAVIDISVNRKERIDVMNTNFVISKQYTSLDKNRMSVVVRIPDTSCSQPLIVTSDNYEDCTIHIGASLRVPQFDTVPKWFTVSLSAKAIKPEHNHIVYDESQKTTKVTSKAPLKVRNIGSDTIKRKVDYFKYVGAYQNELFDKKRIDYTAIDVNLRREKFDIEKTDIILKKIKYPGKIRVVIKNSDLNSEKCLVIVTDHYPKFKINIPHETISDKNNNKTYKSLLKTKCLYNVILDAPPIENCICVVSIDTGRCAVPEVPEMIDVVGNAQLGIKDFQISKYEITNAQFEQVMGYCVHNSIPDGTRKSYDCSPKLPKTWVTWDEAMMFCRKYGELIGEKVSLPTEQQWEYAAKGGNHNDTYKFSGSNKLDDVAWYADNSNGKTHPVCEKMPNSLGIYGMTGNAKEWCRDDVGHNRRTVKGGGINQGYSGKEYDLLITTREQLETQKWSGDLGFRIVINP